MLYLAIPVGDAIWDCRRSFVFFFLFFSFFFFFFPSRFCPGYISGTVTRRDSQLSVLLGPAVWLCTVAYHPIHFVIYLFFIFSVKILSGPYLWNRYLQKLQIECAAWSCSLILHCCLPSNLLCYFFLFLFFRYDFVQAISLEPLLAETPNWVCCLVLRSDFALLLTIQFALLFFIFYFFPPWFCPGHISGTVTRRDSKLSVLLGPAV